MAARVGVLIVGIALLIVGVVLHNHYGPISYLCDSPLGQAAQGYTQLGGTIPNMPNCSGVGIGNDAGWLLIVLGIIGTIAGVIGVIQGVMTGQLRPVAAQPALPADVAKFCHECGAEFTRTYTGSTCPDCGSTLDSANGHHPGTVELGEGLANADIILSAATRTVGMVPHERFAKLIRYDLSVCGKEMLQHVFPGDESGLFVPVQVHVNDKWEPGGVLTLQDRAVVGWFTGTLHVEIFTRVVPYDAIVNINSDTVEPATRLNPEKVVIAIETDPPFTIRVLKIPGEMNMPNFLTDMVLGAVKFDQGTAS